MAHGSDDSYLGRGALRGGLVGAAVVATVAGLLALGVLWLVEGRSLALASLPVALVIGVLFGFVAGAIAGTSDGGRPRRRRRHSTARMRAKTSSGSPTPSTSVTMPFLR